MAKIDNLRNEYHKRVCAKVIFKKSDGIPSMADIASKLSCEVSQNLMKLLSHPISMKVEAQTVGDRFMQITKEFLEKAFNDLQHIRPGKWKFSVHDCISDFDQYRHLGELAKLSELQKSLKTVLGDYVISPDIVIARNPVTDEEINKNTTIVGNADLSRYTPLRASNTVLFCCMPAFRANGHSEAIEHKMHERKA